jgi:hypothetical protein
MKNVPVNKLVSLINAVKGKKPVVIIISVVAVAAAIFAVNKGYISEDVLNVEALVSFVEDVFASDSSAVSDTLVVPVDTTVQIVDTLAN